jgi:hypothetical protein
MRLYHFTTREFGLLALQNRRLKIARISELNDPFEFMSWEMSQPQVREEFKKSKNEWDKSIGIVCFSEHWHHPILWSHYAEKHQGMAIGFEVPDNKEYYRVGYVKSRTPVPVNLTENDVYQIVFNKFEAWTYESEYRCVCRLSESVKDGDYYFEPFSDKLSPVEIIIGCESTISRAELAKTLGGNCSDIESFKADTASKDFRVVRNMDERLWK